MCCKALIMAYLHCRTWTIRYISILFSIMFVVMGWITDKMSDRPILPVIHCRNAETSMHSSRMRTARRLIKSEGGGVLLSEGVCLLREVCLMREGGLPSHGIVGRYTPLTDRQLWTHYFPATSFAGGNNNGLLMRSISYLFSCAPGSCRRESSPRWSVRSGTDPTSLEPPSSGLQIQ